MNENNLNFPQDITSIKSENLKKHFSYVSKLKI